MPRPVGAYLFISRVINMTAHITDQSIFHALRVPKRHFDAPETARPECSLLQHILIKLVSDMSIEHTEKQAVRIRSICSHSRSEEHTSELQSRGHLVCRLLLE